MLRDSGSSQIASVPPHLIYENPPFRARQAGTPPLADPLGRSSLSANVAAGVNSHSHSSANRTGEEASPAATPSSLKLALGPVAMRMPCAICLGALLRNFVLAASLRPSLGLFSHARVSCHDQLVILELLLLTTGLGSAFLSISVPAHFPLTTWPFLELRRHIGSSTHVFLQVMHLTIGSDPNTIHQAPVRLPPTSYSAQWLSMLACC